MSDFGLKLEKPTRGEKIIEVLEHDEDFGFEVEVLDREILDIERIDEAQQETIETSGIMADIPSMNFPKKDGLQFAVRKKPENRVQKVLSTLRLYPLEAAAFEIDPDKKYSRLADDPNIGYKSKRPVGRSFNEEAAREFEGFARELNRRLGYEIREGKSYISVDLSLEEDSDYHFKCITMHP